MITVEINQEELRKIIEAVAGENYSGHSFLMSSEIETELQAIKQRNLQELERIKKQFLSLGMSEKQAQTYLRRVSELQEMRSDPDCYTNRFYLYEDTLARFPMIFNADTKEDRIDIINLPPYIILRGRFPVLSYAEHDAEPIRTIGDIINKQEDENWEGSW